MTPVETLIRDIRRVVEQEPVAVYLAADVFEAIQGELRVDFPGGFNLPVYVPNATGGRSHAPRGGAADGGAVGV